MGSIKTFDIRYSRMVLFVFIMADFMPGIIPVLQTTHVCSPERNYNESCPSFNASITCADNERILIRDAVYGFRLKFPISCALNADGCLRDSRCCSAEAGDETLEYTTEQKYDVCKDCSWMQKCSKRLPVGYSGKTPSFYSIIMHECIQEKEVIHLCRDAKVTGKSINILFDGQKSIYGNSTECVCHLIPMLDKVSYTVNAPDLRLMSKNHDCSTKATISWLGNANITCTDTFTNRTSIKEMLGRRVIRLSFQEKPEFIWLKADVQGPWFSPVGQLADHYQLSVQCYSPTEQTFENEQQSPNVSHTATPSAASVFPVIAVVVPLVLGVSGLAVLLIFIIRFRTKKLNEDKSEANNTDKGESVHKMKYDTLFSPESAVRKDDNYLVLESENTYSTIRNDEVYPIPTISKDVRNNEVKGGMYMSLAPEGQDGHGYDYVTSDREPAMGDESYNDERIEEDMNSVINDLEQDKHDYLVLEPQSLYQYADTAGLSNSDMPNPTINATNEAELTKDFETREY